jgi:hypothetical protein
VEKKFTIEKADWNNDKPVLYVEGEAVAGKPRGNSISGKRARKKVKYSDDGQEEVEEVEEETNQYNQDSTDNDVQPAACGHLYHVYAGMEGLARASSA